MTHAGDFMRLDECPGCIAAHSGLQTFNDRHTCGEEGSTMTPEQDESAVPEKLERYEVIPCYGGRNYDRPDYEMRLSPSGEWVHLSSVLDRLKKKRDGLVSKRDKINYDHGGSFHDYTIERYDTRIFVLNELIAEFEKE